jgi:flagellar biosynthesis/type III secretory pathway chaperone
MLALALSDVLEREITCAQALAAILSQEQHALRTRDAASLDRLVEAKKANVDTINELDARCKELLQSCGFSTDREGLEACFHHCDTEGKLVEHWTLLTNLLRGCAEQNRTNGNILEVNHRAITRLLDAMGTQSPQDQLYGPQGQAIDNPAKRPLARA